MTEKRFIQSRHWCVDRIEKRKTTEWDTVIDWLNELDSKYVDEFALRETLQQELQRVEGENEQLKQRNTNQYNQLTEIWEIIEEENWEKLIAMKKQLKEDEKRLQKEWKCYE